MQILERLFKKSNCKFFIISIILCFFISCTSSDNWYFKEGGTLMWLDTRHSDKAVKSAIHQNLEHSSIIVAQIPWSPGDSTYFKNTAWYFSLAKDHGKSFMVNIDWQKIDRSGTGGEWSFTDPNTASHFKKDMLQLVKTYNPAYINLGVEANYYALTSSDGFRAFVSLFRELKKEFKKLNPSLKVGLSYQLELLFGHHEGWNESKTFVTLEVIQSDIDFLGISTYPNIAIDKNWDDVLFSTKYLDSLKLICSVPMGISETAVSSKLYNEDQREAYMKKIFTKAKNLDLKFVIWGSIIDSPQDESWSDKIGLLDKKGYPKPEFVIWARENENFFR